jgi:hypothetical protein
MRPRTICDHDAAANVQTRGIGGSATSFRTASSVWQFRTSAPPRHRATELEILERPSLNKRKRRGVHATSWRGQTALGFEVGKATAHGLRNDALHHPFQRDSPSEETVDAYDTALSEMRAVDSVGGSGAFLITALRFLIEKWATPRAMRRDRFDAKMARDDDGVIRDIFRRNICGVDINAASVEIATLALWLHTARGDEPLSGLDDHIQEGKSLIGPEFYDGLAPYTDKERERINAFDWQAAFPEVLEDDGFEAVIGNPPYVKLQNFRKFLARSPVEGGSYASTEAGNFDLFLPFIERAPYC